MSKRPQPNTLAAFRAKRGLVQADAARLVGCTAQRISDFEHGRRQPSLDQAAAFSVVYADNPGMPVPLEQLFPSLYARVRTVADKQWKALIRSRQRTQYAPKLHTSTVLALYCATPQTIGMTLFETA